MSEFLVMSTTSGIRSVDKADLIYYTVMFFLSHMQHHKSLEKTEIIGAFTLQANILGFITHILEFCWKFPYTKPAVCK